MPIDYSKWDKLELSDDSDVEVHPNVDKNSFIKWKQRDIHEKRHQRNIEIKSILVQLTMYAKLNERVDFLLTELSDAEILDDKVVISKLNDKFDKNEKFDYEALLKQKGDSLRKGLKDLEFDASEIENTPPYNEMIEDLFIQVKEDHSDAVGSASKLREYLKEHRNKIDDVLSTNSVKLDELLYQKSLLISSDDYHTGFDRSFLNKSKDEDKPPAKSEKTTTIETLNNPSASEPKTEKEMLEDLEVLPATEEFSKISIKNLKDSSYFLIKNTNICSEAQKDALIMTAFDHQLAGDSETAKQVIHQSLLLQYVAQLAGPTGDKEQVIKAIRLFFTKITDDSSPAKGAFLQDVDNTFNHIKQRCQIIQAEQAGGEDGEQEALIQLRALDEGTELSVEIPKEGTPEYEIFTTKVPVEMQEAVRTGSLDAVNEVFAKYKIEEAEHILEVINECGVIGVSGYLENENEFQELKKQYNENQENQDHSTTDDIFDTADIVD